ncbi:MAG: hypothetical protein M1298_00045 [Chloroflexi bacterium]|nr:hypothetical protein [Chloroflexota bacterium]
MLRLRRFVLAALSVGVLVGGLAFFAVPSFADNAESGTLPPSPNPSTPEAAYYVFTGPADNQVTITLTYSPNAIIDSTGHPFDSLVGFNVYGDNGVLFGKSGLVSPGDRSWNFMSTSDVHQYTVQVFNYAESQGVSYTLSLQGATIAPAVTPTPTANPLVVPAVVTPLPTPTPLPAVPLAAPTPQILPETLMAPGQHVSGSLVGDVVSTLQDIPVTGTSNGSSITLTLTAQESNLIQDGLAGFNVYQMQGGVKVLIAVALPPTIGAPAVTVTFPGATNGYGDFLAEIYNGQPGATLHYTLTRS